MAPLICLFYHPIFLCFLESDLKILLIHLEEWVGTHCADVNVSGRVGAANCSIDAFSRHPYLKKMIVIYFKGTVKLN